MLVFVLFCIHVAVLGWGLLSQFLPFRYFPNFSVLSKQTLAIEYHVYIWQVSPQLSCGDTCQIWMWFEKSNMYFCHIENFAYGEINERSFSNPHPWMCSIWIFFGMLPRPFDSFPPGQDGCHFADHIFKCIFIKEKFCNLIVILLKFVPKGPNQQEVSVSSGNGLPPNSRQAITWTNTDPVRWRIYAALRGDEFISP